MEQHLSETENSNGYVKGEDEYIKGEDEYVKGEVELSIPPDRLSSSSVSSASDVKSAKPNFSFDDSYLIDKLDKGSFAIVDQEECDVPQTLPGDDASSLESPPVQEMERPAEASEYRIPAYVFASKANHPEWSTTSNESLFSIHTGNMSFTRDQFSWLLKSGELGMYGGPGDVRKSVEIPPPSPKHVPKLCGTMDPYREENIPTSSLSTPKSGEDIIAAHFKITPAVAATSAASTSDKETDSQASEGTSSSQISSSQINSSQLSESSDSEAEMKKHDPTVDMKDVVALLSPSDDAPLTTCVSHHSDTSGQSFAFPLLAEIGRDKSVNSGQSHIRADQQKNSETDQEATNKPRKTTAEATPSFTSWISSLFSSCRSCCPCC